MKKIKKILLLFYFLHKLIVVVSIFFMCEKCSNNAKNVSNASVANSKMSNFFKKRKDLLIKRDTDAVRSLNERGTLVNPYANSLVKKTKSTMIAVR